jgi:hypothetical protein
MKTKFDRSFSASIDLTAFVKDQLRAAADVASGRITPAEGKRLVVEGRRTIKAAEAALKMSRPGAAQRATPRTTD